jgi:ketosteroid isomerase-like protein
LSAPTPFEVVEHYHAAWLAGDVDGAIRYIAEDCVYALHISKDLLPHGGETVGRANIAAALRQTREDFEYLLYRPHNFREKGEEVRFRVEFMYRHRASGEILSGNFRLIMRVVNCLIVRGDEFHDRAKVEAFLRLFGKP